MTMRAGLCVGAGVMLVFAGAALAADEPENLIKYRQNIMKANAAHLAALTSIVRSEVSFLDDAAPHAGSLQGMAKTMDAPFGPSSDSSKFKTRAKPDIWQNRVEWMKSLQAFQNATATLVKASQASDRQAVTQAVAAVGQACGGCHKQFRAD